MPLSPYQKLLAIDYAHASGRERPLGPEAEIYRFAEIEPNALQAEFLALQHPEAHLPSIKALLQRGSLAAAKTQIDSLSKEADPLAQTEAALERARLAAFEGRWSDVISEVETGIRLSPPMITLVSLLQTRSVAFYELGFLKQSLRDVELVLSQLKFVPEAVAGYYARIQVAKIRLETDGVATTLPMLEGLWAEVMADKELNLCNLLVLIRLESDLCKKQGGCWGTWAAAALIVAEKLGNRLYEGLALVDLYFSLPPHRRPELLPKVMQARSEYQRVEQLYADGLGQGEYRSLTGMNLRRGTEWIEAQRAKGIGELENFPPETRSGNGVTSLVFGKRGFVVDLESRRVCKFDSKSKQAAALELLGRAGEIEKSNFFKSVWGHARYREDLHDGTVRTFLSRLRESTGIQVVSQNGKLRMEQAWVSGERI